MLHFIWDYFFSSENVALNRSAWQYFSYPGRPWGAERAVDGHKSNLSDWGVSVQFLEMQRKQNGGWTLEMYTEFITSSSNTEQTICNGVRFLRKTYY